MPLTIAIDYDDTFTADPPMWRRVIAIWQECGHRVICVSARRNTLDHRRELEAGLPEGVPILLSYDTPKRQYAKQHGYRPDIWVDDMPEAIPTKDEFEVVGG